MSLSRSGVPAAERRSEDVIELIIQPPQPCRPAPAPPSVRPTPLRLGSGELCLDARDPRRGRAGKSPRASRPASGALALDDGGDEGGQGRCCGTIARGLVSGGRAMYGRLRSI